MGREGEGRSGMGREEEGLGGGPWGWWQHHGQLRPRLRLFLSRPEPRDIPHRSKLLPRDTES